MEKKEIDCNPIDTASFLVLFKAFDSILHEIPLKN